jgi:hypothetical protein
MRTSATSCTREGISREGDLLDLAVTHKVVEKSGRFSNGANDRAGTRETQSILEDNPGTCVRMGQEVRAHSASPRRAQLTEATTRKKPLLRSDKQ